MSEQLECNSTAVLSESMEDLFHFQVSGVQLCIPLSCVTKVLPLMSLQSVPGAPAFLLGIMNLHGESVPLLDLACRLGIENLVPLTVDTQVLLCQHESLLAGLVIDHIIGIVSDEGTTSHMHQYFDDESSPYEAVVYTDQGLSLLLRPARVLNTNHEAINAEHVVDPNLLLTTQRHHIS